MSNWEATHYIKDPIKGKIGVVLINKYRLPDKYKHLKAQLRPNDFIIKDKDNNYQIIDFHYVFVK